MQGFALTSEQIIEVLSVYATAEASIDAVAATPGWNVIGAFAMPASADVRVDCLGLVSSALLSLRVRLFCTSPGMVGPVSGSEAVLATLIDSQAFSGVFELEGGKQYQFQAEVTGSAGADLYGTVRRATLAGA